MIFFQKQKKCIKINYKTQNTTQQPKLYIFILFLKNIFFVNENYFYIYYNEHETV